MIPLLYMSILYYMYIHIYYTTVSTVITLHSHFQMGNNNNNNGLWGNFSIVLPISVLSESVCERRLQLYYNYYYYYIV